MSKRAFVAFVVVAVGALSLVACGGDDDDSASAGSTTTVDAKDLEDAAKAAGVDKECLKGVQAYSQIAANAGAALSGGSDLEKSIEAFKAYAKAAPEAIRDDVGVLADAYGTFYRALADSGWDPSSGKQPTSEQVQALTDASSKLDDAKVKAAGDKVSAYFDEHCKGSSGG